MSSSIKITDLRCGWKGCTEVVSLEKHYLALSDHIAKHFKDVQVFRNTDNEEFYLCFWTDCKYTTQLAEEIMQHMKYHAYHTRLKAIGEQYAKINKLPKCNEPVLDMAPLESQKCKWDDCEEQFNCQEKFVCHVYCHIAAHDQEKEKNCRWGDCELYVAKKSKLKEHIKQHIGHRTVGCPDCGHLFCSFTKFSNHRYRQIPAREHTFRCSHCLSWFPTDRLLRDHMRLHVQHHKCPSCGLTCRSPSILAAHIRYRHLDDKPFACTHCPHRCKSEYDLRLHSLKHAGDVKYLCPNCDHVATSKKTLLSHIHKIHNNRETLCYACHLCDKRYSRGTYLTKHLCTQHKVQKPCGFSRFSYRQDEDGLCRLQTTRLESIHIQDSPLPFPSNSNSDNNVEEEGMEEEVDDPAPNPDDIPITIELVNETGEVIRSTQIGTSLQKGAQILSVIKS